MSLLETVEHAVKGPVWGCRMCGQCVLHDTGMTCPITCPKTLRNGPCGGVRADGERLTSIAIGPTDTRPAPDALTEEAAAQIVAWFAGRLTRFDLRLAPAATPRGGVLRAALEAIGYGETASYGEVARAAGSSGESGCSRKSRSRSARKRATVAAGSSRTAAPIAQRRGSASRSS